MKTRGKRPPLFRNRICACGWFTFCFFNYLEM